MEEILEDEAHCEYDDLNVDPDKWLMDNVLLRAVRLWNVEGGAGRRFNFAVGDT